MPCWREREPPTYSYVTLRNRMHVQLFVHMCDSGVQADAVTCCSLINAMDKAGMWQVAELLLLAMDARGGALSALRVLPPPQFSKLTQEEAILVEMLRSRLLVGTTDLPPGLCSKFTVCTIRAAQRVGLPQFGDDEQDTPVLFVIESQQCKYSIF